MSTDKTLDPIFNDGTIPLSLNVLLTEVRTGDVIVSRPRTTSAGELWVEIRRPVAYWYASKRAGGRTDGPYKNYPTRYEQVIFALAELEGWVPWLDTSRGPEIDQEAVRVMARIGRQASTILMALADEPPEDEKAYNGDYVPQTRELTPRERDILGRVISSILHPFTASNKRNPAFDEARAAIDTWVILSSPGDLQVLERIRSAIDPRRR